MTKLFFLSFLFPVLVFSQPTKVKIYPFKSAIIEYKYEASYAGTHIKYIDEFGYKQADYINKKMNLGSGLENESEIIILIGEKAYTVNLQDSTVTIGRNATYDYYLEHTEIPEVVVTEAILRSAYGYQLKGSQTYLKKACKFWVSGNSKMLTWNGLEMKSEINFMTMMVEKAIKVKIDKKLPKDIFDIPIGFRYISSDQYQGFSGLELSFDSLKKAPINDEESSEVKAEFSTRSLGSCTNFKYFNSSGKQVSLEGINDYNKVDALLIKSQSLNLASQPLNIDLSRTVIFQTSEGLFGKMQLASLVGSTYTVRFAIFDKDGRVQRYSDGSSNLLPKDFKLKFDNKTSKLQLIPLGKAKCFTLGW